MSTPTERQNLINSLIIDNNTGQVSPAKMREVLTALNIAIVVTEPSGVSAVLPLSYSNFTNQFSISLATALQDGYISKEDWIKFNTAATAPQADKITIKHKRRWQRQQKILLQRKLHLYQSQVQNLLHQLRRKLLKQVVRLRNSLLNKSGSI